MTSQVGVTGNWSHRHRTGSTCMILSFFHGFSIWQGAPGALAEGRIRPQHKRKWRRHTLIVSREECTYSCSPALPRVNWEDPLEEPEEVSRHDWELGTYNLKEKFKERPWERKRFGTLRRVKIVFTFHLQKHKKLNEVTVCDLICSKGIQVS